MTPYDLEEWEHDLDEPVIDDRDFEPEEPEDLDPLILVCRKCGHIISLPRFGGPHNIGCSVCGTIIWKEDS